jgi:hypothetical protein
LTAGVAAASAALGAAAGALARPLVARKLRPNRGASLGPIPITTPSLSGLKKQAKKIGKVFS